MDILESEHLQALRKAIQEGIDSGPGLPANEVFDRLEKKYLALAEKKQ
jgi:antitoxin ParD1/3/4